MRKIMIVLAALAVTAGLPALAFHDDGVADCAGCHTMHNSDDGAPVDAVHPNGNQYLLVDATPSDVCLGCHATRSGSVLGTDFLNPPTEIAAGNFVFLLEDNINDGHGGSTNAIAGERGGHNLNAPGHGIATDSLLASAPGGTFSASLMGCSSCHDPHGTADYRLLYGAGRNIQGTTYQFTNPAPIADDHGWNAEANNDHVAYKSGMSEWCANCHGQFHNNSYPTVLKHPTGSALGTPIATAYGLYNGTIQYATGTPGTSYLAQVPFEDAAMTTTSTGAPTGSSQVMCLTCHRAHASSAVDSGRWDFSVSLMEEDGDESGSFDLSTLLTGNYADPEQRSLCNKCHVKDAFDLGSAP